MRDPASVHYKQAGREYFEARGLRRYARVLDLWALGVGAVISGDFFGWNFGLISGGFGGMFLALVVMTGMYAGLCFSIAEMSPALPHTGGAYSFARTAMGPWAGYVTGLAENMEYILTPAVIVVGIGGYLGAIFETPKSWEPAWWFVCYVLFVALNIWGVELSFRFSVVITVAALAILVVFWVGALPRFDFNRWALDVPPAPGHTRWLPHGAAGILGALPFALWFYLAIEQLPLAAEESHDPKRDMPKGILYGLATLIVCSFLTLILSVGIAPGAAEVGRSAEPLFLGFQSIFGKGMGARLLALIACTGLIASFHTIIFAYGRQIFSLSRAGYFPSWLSVTHPRRKTPHRALLAGSALGYLVALAIHLSPQNSPVGAVLLNMAVFGAVIAYVLQMASFLALRSKMPEMERPYVSPLGVAGALLAAAIALVTLATLFLNADYRRGVAGAAVWFVLGLLYFALYARGRLILSPEEEFAVSQREKAAHAAR
ncbi:MAG: ethanolamine permease [Bryobacteraceae bacterium]